MSSLHDSNLGDFTRGGQVTIHFFHMMFQVFKKFIGLALIIYSLTTGAIWYAQTTEQQRYVGYRYIGANIGVFYGNDKNIVPFERADGSSFNVSVAALASSESMRRTTIDLAKVWGYSMGYSAIVAAILLLITFTYLFKFGASQRKEIYLRGGSILPAKELGRQLKKQKKASALTIASVPLVKHSETSHILLTGSPGTGKSTTLFDLLKVIRARGDRVICFSTSGDFIQSFYKEGDHILNPFDARFTGWNLWDECTDEYHFDMLAAAIIPEQTKGDPFWNMAARTLVSSVLRVMKQNNNTSLDDFLRILTKLEIKSLHKYLKGTEAASLIDPESEKTAVSIRATAANYARAFKFVDGDSGEAFQMRKWVHEERGADWAFLNAKPDQLDSIRPVLSAWVEVLTNSLMSLEPSRTRRVWLILDELPALNKIPSLADFLAQARKYGGCGVLSFQQISQLRDRYGKDGAESLTGLCSTWVCMRQNDPEIAAWAAKSFGETEIMDSQQGISYGAHEIRDGVNLSAQRKKVEVLLPSEISNLDDLSGYVRLPGDYPIGYFEMKWQAAPDVARSFIPSSRSQIAHIDQSEADTESDDDATDEPNVVIDSAEMDDSPAPDNNESDGPDSDDTETFIYGP